MKLALLVCLALVSVAGAHPYSNFTFNYSVDLPAGWVATGGEDANPAEFTGPGGIAAKIRVIPRPQELTPAMVAKLAKSDEEKIGAKFPRSRPFNVVSSGLGSLATQHYGFVYIDAKTEPRVLRFSMASRAAPAGHTWLKVQFAYPRLVHAQAQKDIDGFLKAFRWIEAPVVAAPKATGAMPALPGLPDATAADVQAALSPSAPLPVAAEPASGPAGEQPDADSNYYLSLNQKMSEKDTQAHIETFRGGAEHRTEEEMARAREYGMGGILKTNE